MIQDTWTQVWKEWKEFLSQGSGRGRWYPLIFVAVFGVFLPMQAGRAWLESPVSLVYLSWIPFLLGSGWAADSFAGERERHTLETLLASRLSDDAILLGKVIAIVCYGWGISLLGLIVSVVTVNVLHPEGGWTLFPPYVLWGDLILTLLISVLAVAVGILVSLRAPTVRQASQKMSIGVLLIAWGPILAINVMPDAWRRTLMAGAATALGETDLRALAFTLVLAVAAGLVIVNALLLLLARSRFRRERLLLD
jgi:ABC-2 type transport system permease protein